MRRYDTILWDLDGTLLDTLDDLGGGVNASLAQFGMPEKTKKEIRSFIGNGIVHLLELSVPGGKQNLRFEEVLSFFKAYYSKHSADKTRPYAGLEKTLAEMKSAGYRMAVVSNKVDTEVRKLTDLFFGDTMDAVVGNSEGLRGKPYPDEVEKALRTMGAEKESAVYIGDTEIDVETAKNAGMDCICVCWGYRDRAQLEAAGAELIAGTPRELEELLL